MFNNTKIIFQLIFNNIYYIKKFDSYDFNFIDYFSELSSKTIYYFLKDTLSLENIKINKEEKNNLLLKITLSITIEFDKEDFNFYVTNKKKK